MRGKTFVIGLCIFGLLIVSTVGFGHDYRRSYSDNPLRYLAYAVYPIGLACEYLITRPIHWLVTQGHLSKVFGHISASPDDICFEW
jgi:hypothetical protein